ncbi:hypothetical protein [Bradyrhizobium japonicum]|uniref:hypothetical protein n=1 Tax=Bradyrhizobium japonicum TaxID=375 RepID=UPI003D9BFB33
MPIVLASGYSDEDLRSRVATLDRLHILTKPFSPEELTSALRKAGVKAQPGKE